MTDVDASWSRERFVIDLHSVRDHNLVVALVGYEGPQRVPMAAEDAVVVDEDGYSYDATVESVRPDHRIYLRVDWATRRMDVRMAPLIVDGTQSSWSVNNTTVAAAAR